MVSNIHETNSSEKKTSKKEKGYPEGRVGDAEVGWAERKKQRQVFPLNSHLSPVIDILQQRHHVDWIITDHIFSNERAFSLLNVQKLLVTSQKDLQD